MMGTYVPPDPYLRTSYLVPGPAGIAKRIYIYIYILYIILCVYILYIRYIYTITFCFIIQPLRSAWCHAAARTTLRQNSKHRQPILAPRERPPPQRFGTPPSFARWPPVHAAAHAHRVNSGELLRIHVVLLGWALNRRDSASMGTRYNDPIVYYIYILSHYTIYMFAEFTVL